MSKLASKPSITPERLSEVEAVVARALNDNADVKTPDTGDLLEAVNRLAAGMREQSKQIDKLTELLETKEAERDNALQEAQALTHLGSWQWDVVTNAIFWSDELYRIYGLRPGEREIGFEEFIGLIHEDDRERVQTVIGTAFASGKPFEFEHRIILPNGAERVLYGMGKVVSDSDGKPIRMVGTSQDVTERKQAELAMRQSDHRFKAVTRASHDLVYDLDLQQGSLWCNEALFSEYGYDKAMVEPTREWWNDRIHPDDAISRGKQLRKLLAGKHSTWDTEYRFKRADDTYADVRNRAFVLRDADGKAERLIGSFLDVTKQKQLDRAKDEFISLASHQLRTPLTVIRMYSEMLTGGMSGTLTKKQHDNAQLITDASVRLINLVGQMLTISRLELNRVSLVPAPIDVNSLIGTYINELQPVADAKGVVLTFQPKETILAPVDPTSFGQVIHNLLANAVTYVPPNTGKVSISFRKEPQKGYVLEVRDNGIGVPKAEQEHIFQRFYRAENSSELDANGTGLGLYLVKLIVNASGGSVSCDSTRGKGSIFTVCLPFKKH